jgi:hypothetical protein
MPHEAAEAVRKVAGVRMYAISVLPNEQDFSRYEFDLFALSYFTHIPANN